MGALLNASEKVRRLVVVASGTSDPMKGGSGFRWLVEATETGVISNANVVAVISNHDDGSIARIASELDIPFHYVPKGCPTVSHRAIIEEFAPDLTCLSGCLFPICDLETGKIINVHPGDTSVAGGPGMYGHHVHKAVMEAYHRGEITESAVTLHFVTERYDEGPVFFRYPVAIRPDDTPESLGARVNEVEHAWQAYVTGLVLDGKIWYNTLNGNVVVEPHISRTLHQFLPETVVAV